MKPLILALITLLSVPVMVFAAPPEGRGKPGGGDTPPPANPIVVLDAGHGGTDSGTTQCPGLYEKDANLDIAQKTESILESAGYTVYLTRTGDQTLSNNDRYTFANSVGGNALVSIHLNGSTDPSVNGTQSLYGKKNKDEAFARIMQQELLAGLGLQDRGVTNFASGVLLKSNMPSVLAESVFLSNTTECQLMTNGTGVRQQQIAEALAQGVRTLFGK